MRILSALRVAGLLGAALVWGCSNGSTGRDDHAATHPDPDPPTSNDPPPPPSVPPPPVVKPPPPPPPPWNAGTPEPGMVIHSEVGSVRGVSVDDEWRAGERLAVETVRRPPVIRIEQRRDHRAASRSSRSHHSHSKAMTRANGLLIRCAHSLHAFQIEPRIVPRGNHRSLIRVALDERDRQRVVRRCNRNRAMFRRRFRQRNRDRENAGQCAFHCQNWESRCRRAFRFDIGPSVEISFSSKWR